MYLSGSAVAVLAIFGATLIGLIRFQRQPAAVFAVVMLVLYATNLVSTNQLLSSISNPGLLTLTLLVLCSIALEKTRLLRVLATFILRPSLATSGFRLYLLVAASSAFLNNTAIVASLLAPVRNNPYHAPSKLLLPLSYAAILGGTLTLVGTSTNLIVSSMYRSVGGSGLHFFDFTLIGCVLVLVCGGVLFLTIRWLPENPAEPGHYKHYLIDTQVGEGSPLIGKSLEANGLRHLESLFVAELVRDKQLMSPVHPGQLIQAGDRLIFSGDVAQVSQLRQFPGLDTFADSNGLLGSNLTEVVIRPESMLIGKTLKSVNFRSRFDAAVVAIRRDGEPVSGKLGEVVLQSGDFLVLAVGPDFSSRDNLAKNFIHLSGVAISKHLTGWREWLAIGGFILAILLSAIGAIPLLKGLVVLLGILVFSNCLSVNELVRRFPRQLWLIVASALLLSQALTNSGLAAQLTHALIPLAHLGYGWLMIAMLYIVTWLLTELVTNNAAAALVFPLAWGMAQAAGINPIGPLMVVAYAASASFISPYGYQTNLMVYNAGHYRISDFLKVGGPLALIYGVIVITLVPIVFH
ncbi:SLC13 family permease [Celerinatantimonas sp. MCCC 1A17872]|uniref:SLC13 family permease n=1 Tax=Celerinatantimonas sp. MCCC 1A17872 TaxID=3177514 RepID=UPI0038C3C64A